MGIPSCHNFFSSSLFLVICVPLRCATAQAENSTAERWQKNKPLASQCPCHAVSQIAQLQIRIAGWYLHPSFFGQLLYDSCCAKDYHSLGMIHAHTQQHRSISLSAIQLSRHEKTNFQPLAWHTDPIVDSEFTRLIRLEFNRLKGPIRIFYYEFATF